MKKMKHLSLLLCLMLLVQTLAFPVCATETTAASSSVADDPMPTETEPIPFGEVCIQKGCRTINGMMPLGGSDRRLETAQSAFLYEVNTGTVVYSYNPDLKVHPGSLAKIVHALVVLEHVEMEDEVTVTEGIQSYVPGGASKVSPESLKSNEHLSVGDLLHAMLMINANDAAVALAHHVAGTTDAFLTLMNNRVKQMGCVNTEFGNISGLYTAQSYTTAREMALMMQEVMKNEDLREIMATRTYTIPQTDLVGPREFDTQNYMIDDGNIQNYQDDRVTGGMVSYHESTGASIVCSATDQKDETDTNYLEYIAVVLCATRTFAENGWMALDYGNFDEMTDLLKYGFDNFKVNRIIYDGMSLSPFMVNGGECQVVGQATVDVDSVVPNSVQMNNLQMHYTVVDGGLSAPVKKGQLIATLEVQYRSSVMTEVEVYAMGDVKPADATGVTIRSTAVRSDDDESGLMQVIGTICVIVLGLAVAYLAFNAYMRSKMRARRKRRRAARRRNQ